MDPKSKVNPLCEENFIWDVSRVREHLLEGRSMDTFCEQEVFWHMLLRHRAFEALSEHLDAIPNLNVRDEKGRNWIMLCLIHQAPLALTMEGFRRMDATWWQPDQEGKTVLHYPISSPHLAEAVVVRWWSEQRSRRLLASPFDPWSPGHQLPQQRLWRRWKALIPA